MSLHQTNLVDFGNRSKLKVYPISIGAMRLPHEEKRAVSLIRQAIDTGMIYIDTSRGYGDSEIKVGKSLKDGYRQKV
ncbi:MAG: aldo/keto reductase, partial [Phycisphaerales bacterium]